MVEKNSVKNGLIIWTHPCTLGRQGMEEVIFDENTIAEIALSIYTSVHLMTLFQVKTFTKKENIFR